MNSLLGNKTSSPNPSTTKNKYNLNQYLPVYSYADEINTLIINNQVSIICGRTGCGKTTQIPQLIFNSETSKSNPVNILITQPRRLAAISIANRLSRELHSQLGHLVGYHVGLNSFFSKSKTKIIVKTTGLFLEEIIHERNDLGYTHIILDEVHERDINIDFLLILIKRYIETHAKVKVILMSATISTQLFREYFTNAGDKGDNKVSTAPPIFEIKETIFNITKVYLDEIIGRLSSSNKEHIIVSKSFDISNPSIDEGLFLIGAQLIKYLHNQHKEQLNKGILVFLPGFGEIQSFSDILMETFEYSLEDIDLFILHSNISDEEQEKIFQYNKSKRKIILSTNIAESSITIDNNDFIIDFCLIKELQYDPFNHKESLELKWASQANCDQRAGRTGRVGPGIVFRMITTQFYNQLPLYPSPELLRVSLEKLILKIKVYDCGEPESILQAAIQPPELKVIATTIRHLQNYGALTIKDNSSGDLTPLGRIYAELPIDIRYSRLIMLSFCFDMTEPGIVIASILSQEKKLFKLNNSTRVDLYEAKKHFSLNSNCDMITAYLAYKAWEKAYGKHMLSHECGRRLRHIKGAIIKEELKWCKDHILNAKILKETLVLVADLKKRLLKMGIYKQRVNDKGEVMVNVINFNEERNQLVFKCIMAGAFYENILSSAYIHEKKVKRDNGGDRTTIRFKSISDGIKPKTQSVTVTQMYCDLIDSIAPSAIEEISTEYDETKVCFSQYDAIKKVLFVTSFKHYTDNCTTIVMNNDSLIAKKPEYIYELCHYDLFTMSKIEIHNSSINYSAIEPEPLQLDLNVLICDNYIEHNHRKIANYSSLLPPLQSIDLIIILLFAPNVTFYSNDNKTQYLSFQVSGYSSTLLKFKHLFSGFDVKGINSIRALLNQQVKVNLNSQDDDDDNGIGNNNGDIDLGDIEEKYKERCEVLTKYLLALLNKPRVRMIMKEEYIHLFELLYPEKYIQSKDLYKPIDINTSATNGNGNSKGNNNDFLPPLIPLSIKEDYRLWTNEGLSAIKLERDSYSNMKTDFKEMLNKRLEIVHQSKAQLCCGICHSYICSISSITIVSNVHQSSSPLFKLDGWMTLVIKEIPKDDPILINNPFVLNNTVNDIKPEAYIACDEGTHVIGVKHKDDYYAKAESNLAVKFPMQNYLKWDEHMWTKNFEGIDKEMIIQDKERRKFIEGGGLKCELCKYTTTKEMEYSKHLKSQGHLGNIADLDNEQF